VAILIVSCVIARQWAYAATYRLFLDQRVDDSPQSAVTQRFDLEHGRVVPKILMRDDRVVFRTQIGRDSVIRADLRATPGAAVEIRVRQPGGDHVVAPTVATSDPVAVAIPFPAGTGEIELASRGDVVWLDPRVERSLSIAWPLTLLFVLVASLVTWVRWRGVVHGMRFWWPPLTICASVAISLLLCEAGLRAVGSRVSSSISALRHDLGEPTEDPRWQQTSRYGQRLRPNVDAPSEWRHGDIIRMGFVPPAAGEGRLHRYPFHADSEGFRNVATRDPIDIAALGDSFTDALTMRREDAWPAQLEARLGRSVQNYGTAGFGPQQELLVLKDFALPHRPRVVVLAFFAGNDIRDAEVFEKFQRDGPQPNEPRLGWPIRSVITRADTWFLTSAVQAATRVLAGPAQEPEAARAAVPSAASTGTPSFSRGMFSVDAGGRTLRWALMPPYLNLLNFSERDLASRRGWTLIEENLREMQRVSRASGAAFVVVFIPFKSQVYLPLLERSFDRATLEEALQFYLRDPSGTPDVARLSSNRVAQNALMARFCERAGIPLLDVTSALQARVDAGDAMYFPDDSHLDEQGEALVADRLAAFLEERGLTKP
jgi:lysophospholipase L1-like esterase